MTGETAIIESFLTVSTSAAMSARANVTVVDLSYMSLTDRQIDHLLDYVRRNQHRKRYLEEVWDCDEIAREFRVLAADWAVRSFQPPPPAAVAVATLLLKIRGRIDGIGNYGAGGLHAMVAIRRVDGVWFLVEPAACKRTPLLGPIYEGNVEVHSVEL